MDRLRRIINLAVTVGTLFAGLAVMMWLVKTRPSPPVRPMIDRASAVAVSRVEPQSRHVPVVGYGSVRPKNQVQVVPQISGKLIYAHDDLAQGKIVPSEELLFEIDSTVYKARVLQAQAEISGLEAALARNDQESLNLEARIANAVKMLEIDEKDFETSKRLFDVERVGTERDVDLVFQKYLRQKDVVVELENGLAMIPHTKLEVQAKLEAARASLTAAQHDLENTKIFAPFRARVESINAHTSQVVTAHFSIATLTDMEAFEISVGIDPRNLRWLAEAIRPANLEDNNEEDGPAVKVVWTLPGQEFSWRGHVSRFERVDEATRTARLVVEIRDVEMTATVGAGSADTPPDLSIGMFCRAELPAEPLADALFVPRHAVHEGRWVYVVEPEGDPQRRDAGRLQRREVTPLRTVGDDILVDYRGRTDAKVCDLKAGELLVVSPLIKPVVGMRVNVRDDAPVSIAALSFAAPVDEFALRLAGPARESALPWERMTPPALGQAPSIRR